MFRNDPFFLFMLLTFLFFKINLNQTNFNTAISNPKIPSLIFFFAPWCHHCQHMHPLFNKVVDNFFDDEGILTTEVNCDDNKLLCDKVNINAYPTFIAFYPGGNKTSVGGNTLEILYDLAYTALEHAYGQNVTRTENEPDSFPAFYFKEKSGNTRLLNIARMLRYKPEFYRSKVFYTETNSTSDFGELFVYTDKKTKKECTDDLTYQNITNFFVKYHFDILDHWNYDTVLSSTKLFSIFMPKTSMDFFLLRKTAKRYSNMSTFGNSKAVGTKDVMKKFEISTSELAAIAVYNPETQKFTIGKNFRNITEVEEFYNKMMNHQLDEIEVQIKSPFFASTQQSTLFISLVSFGIGMMIVGVVFYVYNRMLGNIKKHD